MADKIRGITIEIGGDTTGLTKALKGVNSDISSTQKQLKDVEKLLKLDPTNTELLAQKQKLLKDAVSETTDKLDELKKIQQTMDDNGVDKNSDQYMALQREIIATEQSLESLEEAADKSNVAMQKISATADKISDGAGKIADATKGLSTAASGVLAGVGVIGGKAVNAYAEYEQLIGGVETLFKSSSDAVQNYAENAYKTAGLSANEYMETVTSFSASLLQSLNGDTEKAAKVADMAITDMADNANKMGTSMESIQSAYQGFAKQNYNMLDNLKLGYGGTKEEMERLLADAEKFSGIKYDISNLDDVYEAIHVVQTEMGITGTTAKEAEKTISGSLSSLSASWENLLAGIGNPEADIDALAKNVIDAVKTVASNIIPIIQNIWNNIPTGAKVGLIITGIIAAISPVFSAISAVSAGISTLTTTVIPALGSALEWIVANPMALVIAGIVALVTIIATKGDEIQAKLQEVDDFLQNVFAMDFTNIFGPVLGNVLNSFMANVKNIWDNIKQIFNGVIDFIRGVFTGNWERAWNGVKEIFSGIFGGLAAIAKAPINAIIGLLNTAIDALNGFIGMVNNVLGRFGVAIGSVGHIPYLAKGGVLSQGSAVVGEAGPELLTMMGNKAVVQPLTSTNSNTPVSSATMGDIKITVQSVLDGKIIGESVTNYQRGRARAYGV